MTYGDMLRNMDDEELAQVIIGSIEANSDYFEQFRVDLGENHQFDVVDADDLAEILGREIDND